MGEAPDGRSHEGAAARCPCCAGGESDAALKVPYERIWRALEELDSSIPGDVASALTPDTGMTELRRCRSCGLEFFFPLLPGGPDFYASLSNSKPYYETRRWEYEEVRARLGIGDRVADFGCGAGAFVELVADGVARAVGIDTNPAANQPDRRGEYSNQSFEAFAATNAGSFSVVSAFQVLEHVPDAADLLVPMARSLSPRGKLYLSVPDRDRTRWSDFDVLDHPPHHLSRWSADQFSVLADRFGFHVSGVWAEPFIWHSARLEDLVTSLGPLAPCARSVHRWGRGAQAAVAALRRGERPRWKGLSLLVELSRS